MPKETQTTNKELRAEIKRLNHWLKVQGKINMALIKALMEKAKKKPRK